MPQTQTIIDHANVELATSSEQLARTIDVLFACVTSNTTCADACLGEETVAELRDCITTNNLCAEVCVATARALARIREGSYAILKMQLLAAIEATSKCAEECDRHADMHAHCRVCAEDCRSAEKAARAMLDAMP